MATGSTVPAAEIERKWTTGGGVAYTATSTRSSPMASVIKRRVEKSAPPRVHFRKALPDAVAGAVKVTDVPRG